MREKKYIKKLVFTGVVILGLGACLNAEADSYINTDSFGIAEASIGMGQLQGENSIPWSAGLGYQWTIGGSLTGGFEGLYMDNGNVFSNGINLDSTAFAPYLSVYYYVTPHINLIGKIGYAYETSQYSSIFGNTTLSSWEPTAVGGIGFLIPFSNEVYANLFFDATWLDQKNQNSNGITFTNPGVLQNMQYKLGIQFMF